ncbi:MAG: 50S ribosomal protein L35 [Planctomycetota bacterium]
MPKLKTKKSVQKRMRLTKTSKVKRNKAFRRHLMSSKNAKRRRHLRKAGILTGKIGKTMRMLLAPAQ